MKTANEQYVQIRHPHRTGHTLDVVPIRKSETNRNKMVGAVLTPGAGISRVEFTKDDLV